MLDTTDRTLAAVFVEIGKLSGVVTRLKEAEQEDGADPATVEALEEMEAILVGLPGLFDEDEGDD
jgi:hypothetical protein